MIIYVRGSDNSLKYKGFDASYLKRMAVNFDFGKVTNAEIRDGVLLTIRNSQPSRIATLKFSSGHVATVYSQDMMADADAVNQLVQDAKLW